MSFLTLWAAGLAAAVFVPLLLLLYFLKLRRREEPISSTLLWKRAVQDLQVNAPFQRLRKSLLLFLQLLILLLAAFALARPIIQTTVTDQDRLVLLIDNSASMNTIESNGETRLDQAKEQAVRLVKSLNRRTSGWQSIFSFGGANAQTQAMVIAFAGRASIVSPFTTNTAELEALIRGITPTDGQTDLREALELAQAYMAPPTITTDATPISAEVPSTLVLVTDGKIQNLADITLRSGTVKMLPVAEATDNVAVTALRTERNYEQPELLSVFLTVENFGPEPVQTDVSLYINDVLAAVREVSLAGHPATGTPEANQPGGYRYAFSFEKNVYESAIIEARIARDDALKVDNSAWAVIPPPKRLSVLVVTEKNFFIDSTLAGLPLAEYPFVTPDQYAANAGEAYVTNNQSKFDVVIFDKYTPEALPAGNFIFLDAVPPLPGFGSEAVDKPFDIIWWDETNPVLRHVNLLPVVVYRGLKLTLPPEAEVLAEARHGPVIARYATGGRHLLTIGFAVEQSEWWRSPSFPVFLYNAIRYLGGGGAEADNGPTRPGETVRIPLPPQVSEARVVPPAGGASVTVRPDAAGVAYFGDTQQVGVYRVSDGVPSRDRFAVNLEDPAESDIVPLATLPVIGGQQVQGMAAIRTATPEIWRWFIGAALVLVLLEWWIYNRRVML